MRTASWKFFAFLAVQFLAGCAGLTASVSSRNVSGGKIDRAGTFYFPVPERASADDRKVVQAFIDEFRGLGLKVAAESEKARAGYVVALGFADSSSVSTGSVPLSQTQFSAIRDVHGLDVGFVQTGSTAEVPYSADSRVRTVYVMVYAAQDAAASDRLLPVWDGHITAEAGALSSHSRCIVRELVSRLGVDYAAQTRIDIACRNR